jgi:hypothetical protein
MRDAAFMQGRVFSSSAWQGGLHAVIFPDTQAPETAFFALADLYVFPSRHELG